MQILSFVLSSLRAIWRLLRYVGRHWRAASVVILLGAIAALLMRNVDLERQLGDARADTSAERASHELTKATYQAAASLAAKRDAENLARVQAAQHAITEGVINGYQIRLADSASAYERLRAQADAYRRGAVTADVSAAREATCRAYAATACDQLPALLKAAQDNTDQLLALIAWSGGQADVSVAQEPAK